MVGTPEKTPKSYRTESKIGVKFSVISDISQIQSDLASLIGKTRSYF